MQNEGVETLLNEGVTEENIEYFPVLDLRYLGQYHEVQLPALWEDIKAFNFEEISKSFHKEHNRLFGYSLEEEGTEIECINIRLRVTGITEKPEFLSAHKTKVSLESALKARRMVYIPESNESKEINVYDGEISLSHNVIKGPAIIEKVNTSIFVSESYDCLVDEYDSFIIYNKEDFPNGFKLKKNQ
jgi:N-methylhydantoinase A